MVVWLDVAAILIIIGMISMEALPVKPQRIIWGVLIFLGGLFPVLKLFKMTTFDITSYPILRFSTIFMAFIVGEMLFSEGLKEENMAVKIISMIVGVVIILITYIPWMHEFGAVSFDLPSYAPIFDFILYLAAGTLTVFGAFGASE